MNPLQARRLFGFRVEDVPRQSAQSGMIAAGNIDLYAQPRVPNQDGSTSTVDSFSVNMDGKEYLLPTVMLDGRHLLQSDAVDEFKRTGRHLGIFNTSDAATAFAQQLHKDYEAGKYDTRAYPGLDNALRKARRIENSRGGGVEGALRKAKAIGPPKGLVTELPWADEFLGRVRTFEDLLRETGFATSPQEAGVAGFSSKTKFAAEKWLANPPKTLHDWLEWKTQSGHPGIFRAIVDKLGLDFTYPQLDALRESFQKSKKLHARDAETLSMLTMPMEEFLGTSTAKNILGHANEAQWSPANYVRSATAPLKTARTVRTAHQAAQDAVNNRSIALLTQNQDATLQQWMDWHNAPAQGTKTGINADKRAVFDEVSRRLGLKFTFDELAVVSKARVANRTNSQYVKWLRRPAQQFFESSQGTPYRASASVYSASRSTPITEGELIPTFPDRQPVIRTRGYIGTRDAHDPAWLHFQAKVEPEKITYVSLHDAEHLSQRKDWRRRLFEAHPDRGGSDETIIQLLKDRDQWSAKEEKWYKGLGLVPPSRKP